MTGSISFEQAAEYYDETRFSSPQLDLAISSLLAPELAPRGLCLEIGVGTGRIALPLARAGVRMVGIDLSPAMLSRLLEKAGEDAFPVVIGDATALPFPDHLFGAAVAAHVFHLIPNWQAALAELCRVVKSGGVILVSSDGVRDWEAEVSERFYDEAGAPAHPAARPDVAAEMERRGAAVRFLRSRRVCSEGSLEDRIASLEAGHFSRTWRLDPEVRRRAAAATRRWARRTYGDLSALRAVDIETTWEAFDVP